MTYEQEQPVVMIVDDDPLMLKTTGLAIEADGLKVKLCSSGRAAIEGLDKSIYTIVLDITMPDMSGLDVFEELKGKTPWCP